MTTNEIRTKFLAFFHSKGHSIITSDSLVPKDDPTVLFTTAGMQQFKPQFLGRIDGFTRAATCQKCLRTDDLDCVGKTDFHHTFFEMLGNFSFGDYFKKEAIHWAWEFLTSEMKLPKDLLWVSVYQDDQEAYDIWANEIKIPHSRIVKLGDKSNFWPSNARLNGPNGPCGPCSEIFFDYGVNPQCPKGDQCDPDCSCGRFSEVWNLVFTQYNRKEGGVLEPLPAKNIDTGMGLERLAAVVQGKKSNYETDNWAAILKDIKETFKANKAQLTESEYRVVADHMRAITMGIADGVVPSNEGRGYVMRKLIVDITDLAIRAGIGKPVIHTFVDVVIDRMVKPYPEILPKIVDIKVLITRIEETFIKVRKERVPEFQKKALEVKDDPDKLGDLLFLYRDTYGVTGGTLHVASTEMGISEQVLDSAFSGKYKSLMEVQKNRSRAGSKMMGDVFADQDFTLNLPKTQFLGYTLTRAEAKVLQVLPGYEGIRIILDRTLFYAQSGGQVGDQGYLIAPQGKVKVVDTQKVNDIYIHAGLVEQGVIKVGDTVQVMVDGEKRCAIMRNHTATHLLQSALREVLGSHIKQQGSLVDENRLRFDFSHHSAVKPEEIERIENRLNEFIQRNDQVTTEVLPLEEAKQKGALAFFAEKYGAMVRVVTIGDYSREFCGGTHVAFTKDIEAMKLVTEGSVAQGIRRVEALTGQVAVSNFMKLKQHEQEAKDNALSVKQIEKEKQQRQFEKIKSSVDDMIKNAQHVNGVAIITQCLSDVDMGMLRKMTDVFKQKTKRMVLVLGAKNQGDGALLIAVSDDVVDQGIKANELISQVAPIFGGTGGGRPQMAQAGGKGIDQLETALAKTTEIVKALL